MHSRSTKEIRTTGGDRQAGQGVRLEELGTAGLGGAGSRTAPRLWVGPQGRNPGPSPSFLPSPRSGLGALAGSHGRDLATAADSRRAEESVATGLGDCALGAEAVPWVPLHL